MNIIITSFSGPSVMDILQAQGGQMIGQMFISPIKNGVNDRLTKLAKENGLEPVDAKRRKTRREAMRTYLDNRYM